MSKHFYSYQFDMPYRPKCLRNWEVPKYYCPKPRQRLGSTKMIANSRGQLLPGVPRPPCNPFGDFVGTWNIPRRITREIANELNGTANKKAFLTRCAQLASIVPKPKYTKIEAAEEAIQDAKEAEEIRQIALNTSIEETSEMRKPICPIHDF